MCVKVDRVSRVRILHCQSRLSGLPKVEDLGGGFILTCLLHRVDTRGGGLAICKELKVLFCCVALVESDYMRKIRMLGRLFRIT